MASQEKQSLPAADDRRSGPAVRLRSYRREAGRRTFLIHLDGQLAGFVQVACGRHPDRTGHRVIAIFIRPRFRGLGLGSRAAAELDVRFPGDPARSGQRGG